MWNRLRNIRWKAVGQTLLALAVLTGIVLLMGLVREKDAAQLCTSMRVMVDGGDAFVDHRDIADLFAARFGRVVGKPLDQVPVQAMEESLDELPYVASAEIYVDMDGVLQVSVRQREVVLRVINRHGREYYIDAKGLKMPLTPKYVPRVLVANGGIAEGYGKALDSIRTPLLRDLVAIANHVRRDALWRNQTVQLYVNDERDIEIVPRVGTQLLVLGDASNLRSKLDRLAVFYREILPKVGSDAYRKVSVKYEGQIICERRNGWFLDSLERVEGR